MVVASAFDEVVAEARRLLNAPPALRVYGSKDLAGVELASALAGAYTVALGLCDGLGMGPGPRAVLITRAVAEASRLGVAAGARGADVRGLAGLGNLLVRATASARPTTCSAGGSPTASITGRRRAHRGRARRARRRASSPTRLRVRMPVLSGVAAVLAGRAEPRAAAQLVGDTVAVEE